MVAAPVGETFGWLPVGPGTAVVVAMRNQDLDYEATAAALRTPARYVGLIGARRKAILVTERLIADGVPIERVRALRAPIGPTSGPARRRRSPSRSSPSGSWSGREAPGARSVSTSSSSRRPPGAEPPRRPGPGNGVRVVPPESRPETRGGGGAPAGPLPLPLRNRLAELILEAFEPGDARAALRSRGGPRWTARRSTRDADRLLALGWFEPRVPAASGFAARTGPTGGRWPSAPARGVRDP